MLALTRLYTVAADFVPSSHPSLLGKVVARDLHFIYMSLLLLSGII